VETLLATIFNYTYYYTKLLLHSSAILNTFHSAFATITVKQIHTNMWICSIAWKRDNLFKSRRFYCIYCNEIALAKKRLWMCYHASYVTVHHWCYDRFTFTLSQQFITNEVLKLIIHIKIPKLWDLTYSFKHPGQYSE